MVMVMSNQYFNRTLVCRPKYMHRYEKMGKTKNNLQWILLGSDRHLINMQNKHKLGRKKTFLRIFFLLNKIQTGGIYSSQVCRK